MQHHDAPSDPPQPRSCLVENAEATSVPGFVLFRHLNTKNFGDNFPRSEDQMLNRRALPARTALLRYSRPASTRSATTAVLLHLPLSLPLSFPAFCFVRSRFPFSSDSGRKVCSQLRACRAIWLPRPERLLSEWVSTLAGLCHRDENRILSVPSFNPQPEWRGRDSRVNKRATTSTRASCTTAGELRGSRLPAFLLSP